MKAFTIKILDDDLRIWHKLLEKRIQTVLYRSDAKNLATDSSFSISQLHGTDYTEVKDRRDLIRNKYENISG